MIQFSRKGTVATASAAIRANEGEAAVEVAVAAEGAVEVVEVVRQPMAA
jgi:hypothetical protein